MTSSSATTESYHGVFCADGDLERLELDPAHIRVEGAWAWDRDKVYVARFLVEGADPASIEVLGGWFARDRSRVWMRTEALEEISAASVELCCLGGGSPGGGGGVEHVYCEAILKDQNRVFTIMTFDSDYSFGTDVEAVEGADPATYRVIAPNMGLAVDKGGVWLVAERLAGPEVRFEHFPGDYWLLGDAWYHGSERLRQVQPGGDHAVQGEYSIFEVMDPGPIRAIGDGYAGHRFQVWHRGNSIDVDGIDAQNLGCGFLKTRNQIVHFEEIMTSRKVVTYESLGGALPDVDCDSFEVLGDSYAADEHRVYYANKITEIDRSQVALLGGGWARDRNGAYCYGQRVAADPERLRILGGSRFNRYAGGDHGSYATDGATLFRGTSRLADEYGMEELELNPERFEVLGEYFGSDGKHVIDLSGPTWVEEVDPSSFMVLGRTWGRDARQLVWVGGRWPKVLKDVDLESVEAIDGTYVVDANRVYADGKPTEIDRATFRSLPGGWAVDKSGVFAGGSKVEDADPTTFRPSALAPGLMQDDHGVYQLFSPTIRVAAAKTRSLDNGAHWVGDRMLYSRDSAIGAVADDLQVLGEGVVLNDRVVYYLDIALE